MDRKKALQNLPSEKIYNDICSLHQQLFVEFQKQFKRSLPFADEVLDRWERAKNLNFGEGASIYDSSYVFGNVAVGKDTWIGPFTIIDGTGGLTIGDNCTISSSVHIYSHDNIKQTLSAKKVSIEYGEVSIGNCTYIGPQSIISKGVKIGNHCVVASNSLVTKNIPDYSIVGGNPARQIGKVVMRENDIEFDYSQR